VSTEFCFNSASHQTNRSHHRRLPGTKRPSGFFAVEKHDLGNGWLGIRWFVCPDQKTIARLRVGIRQPQSLKLRRATKANGRDATALGGRPQGLRSPSATPWHAGATRFTQNNAAPTALGRIELKIPIKFSTRFGNGRIQRVVEISDWVGQHLSLPLK